MLKLMGELLKGNVALESVEVLRKKIKSIKSCTGKRLRRLKIQEKRNVEHELTMFNNLNLLRLRLPIFSSKMWYQVEQLHRIFLFYYIIHIHSCIHQW